MMKPIWMGSKTASVLWSALEQSAPELCWEKIIGLASKIGIVVITLAGDLDSSNVRAKHYMGELALAHNRSDTKGRILLLDIICSSHILHRIIETTFKTAKLIPSLHATAFTASQTTASERILRTVRDVVRADLEGGGFFPRRQPPRECAALTEKVLEVTLYRGRWTRGRVEQESPFEEDKHIAWAKALRVLNGDWRSPAVEHYCNSPTCCRGVGDATDKITAVLVEVIFGRLSSRPPACNRWYTFGPALECQALGMVLHQILPRVIERSALAGPERDVPKDEQDDPSSCFKEYCGRKERQAVAFLTDQPGSAHTVTVAVVVTEPVDRLSQRFQLLDAASHGISEAVSSQGPLRHCMKHLTGLARGRIAQPGGRSWIGHSFLKQFFEGSPDFEAVMEAFFVATVRVGSQVWARLHVQYDSWPWRLLHIPASELGLRAETPDFLVDEFFAEHLCCLDSWFSEGLRNTHNTPADFTTESRELLRELARHCCVTNMPLENLLAEHKAAAAQKSKKPNLETFTWKAALSALMKQHLKSGGANPIVETRQELLRAGVPIKAQAKGRAWQRDHAAFTRRDTRWRNYVMASWLRQNPCATPEDRSQQVRAFAQQWRDMTEAQRLQAEHGIGVPDVLAADRDDDGLPPHRFETKWHSSDGTWPVSSAVLEAFVGFDQSVVSRATEERWKARRGMIAKDQGCIPPSKVFRHRYSCMELPNKSENKIRLILAML